MRRIWSLSALALVLACLLTGCSKRGANKDDEQQAEVAIPEAKSKLAEHKKKGPPAKIVKESIPPVKKLTVEELARKERYEAHVGKALEALAERKFNDALQAFEAARSIEETEFVKNEIVQLQQRIAGTRTAQETIKNIELVLNDGNAAEAARLATQALQIYGAGDDAPRLVQLRLQAEALLAVQQKEGAGGRFERFRKEGEAAQAEKNLRGAALAFQQALQARDDPALQKILTGLQAQLDTYDALRKKGAELRQDPARIGEAVAALKDAREAWDTPQIRQEIDDALAAQGLRRDNVAVADFDVRNDVGMANVGVKLADALAPLLAKKYDLVPRDQVRQALADLKVGTGALRDAAVQKQVGELVKTRYLVVGHIHRIAAVNVTARLIDTRTGLVVQSARVLAPTMKEALEQVPELARQLLMTDQEKMKAEEMQPAEKVQVIAADAVVPPAPAANAPPPPMFANANAAAVELGGIQPAAFARFAPPPQGFGPAALPLLDPATRNRLLVAAVEMGDYLYGAGRFAEARRQFAFALSLDPANFDIRARLDQCQALVPAGSYDPAGLQSIYVKPRMAVLPFPATGNPFVVPPGLAYWTPANLAPYFSARYDVDDSNLIYWYMSRAGLSMRDLTENPAVLRWLARAAGVRYLVLGNIQQTANFDVNTYLVDAESGYLQGSGRITVQNTFELKLRLPELAERTMMSPLEQNGWMSNQAQFDALLNQGLAFMLQRDYDRAAQAFLGALALRPNSVQAQYYLNQAQQSAWRGTFAGERRRRYSDDQAAFTAQQQQQQQLAQAAEQARQNSAAYYAGLSDADRQANLQLRIQAQDGLLLQANLALQSNRAGLAADLLQGALNVLAADAPVGQGTRAKSRDGIVRELARARQAADDAARLRAAKLTATREAGLRQQRDQQLLAAQQKIAQDQQLLQKAQSAAQTAQTQRDEQAYEAGLKQGQKLFTEQKYDAALAALQGAQRLKATDKVNSLIDLTVRRQAEARAQTEQGRKELERKFLAEEQRRKDAEAQVQKKTEQYKQTLQSARQALAQKNYDLAAARFGEASKLYQTEEVASGLREIEQVRTAQAQRLAAEKKKAAEVPVTPPVKSDVGQKPDPAVAKMQASFQQAMTAGQAAMTNKKYAEAVKSYTAALQLYPNDAGAQRGLQQAQQADASARQQAAEAAQRALRYQQIMGSAQAAMAGKKFGDAVKAYTDALKLMPADAQAQAGLRAATQARDAALVTPPPPPPMPKASFELAMQKAAGFEKEQKYADALSAYQEALKFRPKDADAAQGARKSQYHLNLAQGQQYLARSMFVEATREFEAALRAIPNEPSALKLLQKAKNKMR